MGEFGLAPAIFATQSKSNGSPYIAILFSYVIIVILIAFDITAIMAIDNFFSVASSILEILSFAKLRISQPNLPRPFKVPFVDNWKIMICFLCLPISCSFLVLIAGLFGKFYFVEKLIVFILLL